MVDRQSGNPSICIQPPNRPELWGGVEYTCNRVHNTYLDQMELSGHAQRPGDLEAIAALGIRTLRTGLLWERHEREGSSWEWPDARLNRIRELGLRPIASLVHHGSGPRHTSLLDPHFASKLATYAGQVAERYPWIDAYTPVNEPNTTARFSALYGLWYPHHTSRASFLRALLAQVKGIVLSMRAIRRVRPDARLIQTDDGGSIRGTPELRSTCELLNLRQWLTFDLLCGLVDRHHPMFAYMQTAGISEHEILWFAENPCPPDAIGLNYYVTSDRYLDHRVEHYSPARRSAEGRFVDVEAVRMHPSGIVGVAALLETAWQKYRLPLAITEIHIGCSTESQIRWFAESWRGVLEARKRGVNCVAMTAWALLGSFYWNELVTRPNGYYEPGAFTLHHGEIVPTELAEVMAQIAAGKVPIHRALRQAGWWHLPERFYAPIAVGAAA
jgi:beta-glucosidase/6-phospho-beta-glucosidase/beta-galactosidase